MKKLIARAAFLTALLILSFSVCAFAQTKPLNDLWQQVEKEIENDLPRSAIKTLTSIEELASKAGNNDCLLKAMQQRLQLEQRLYQGDYTALAPQFERQASQAALPVLKAFLYDTASELYAEYYFRNSWRINERPQIDGAINDSIDNWNRDRFAEAVFTTSDRSFGADESKGMSTKEFPELLKSADYSPERCPTLYDYFMLRSIPRAEAFIDPWGARYTTAYDRVSALYDALIAFNQAANEELAAIYNQVARLDFLKRTNQTDGAAFFASLEQLEAKYGSSRYVTVIWQSKIAHYLQSGKKEDAEKAYLLAKKAVGECAGYPEIDGIKGQLLQITWPIMNGNLDNCYPDTKIPFAVSFRNIETLQVDIFRVSESPVVLFNNRRLADSLLPSARKVESLTVQLTKNQPYWQNGDTLLLPALPLGLYQCKITARNSDTLFTQYSILPVSNMTGLSRRLNKGETNCWVVTSKEGQPVEGASVWLYEADRNGILHKRKSLPVGKDGMCTEPKELKGDWYYRVCHKNDTVSLPGYINRYWGRVDVDTRKDEMLLLYTDRSLYRPGETVYFKGILVEKSSAGDKVLPSRALTVSLCDPNGKTVATLNLKSNDFGSVDGSFLLPEGEENNGYYTIRSDKGQTSFHVEYYKRPNFETVITEDEMGYLSGQEVALNGVAKTYSGVPLRNAVYEYTVVKVEAMWPRVYRESKETIATEKGTIDSDGRFTARFLSLPPDTTERGISPIVYDYSYPNNMMHYIVSGTITDSRGETQPFEHRIVVGSKRLFLNGLLPEPYDVIDKSKEFSLTLSAKNASLKEVAVTGVVELLRINEADTLAVQKHDFTGSKELKLNVSACQSGKYLLRAVATSKLNEQAKWQQAFILYGRDDKRPPVDTTLWLVPVNTTLAAGKEAEVIVGSTKKNLYLLYELYGKKSALVERGIIKLNNENQTIRVPYTEALSGGGVVLLNCVRDNRLITERIDIEVPSKAINPEIKWETWRDKLYPADNDTVTLRVTGADKALEAELLATMYDASLDAIAPHHWHLSRWYNSIYIDVPWFDHNNNLMSVYLTGGYAQARSAGFGAERDMMMGSALNKSLSFAAPAMAESSMLMEDTVTDEASVIERESDPVRTDFAATAFFYPALRTDSDGRVSFSFKVPQSLTTWNLRVLASTKEGAMSQGSQKVVTRKELMVMPLLPRFIREGDSLRIRTAINNLLPRAQEVAVECLFFNPVNNDTLYHYIDKLTVPASGEAVITVPLAISGYTGNLVCRVKASGTAHADGVEMSIPVLPSHITIKEGESIELKGGASSAFAAASPNGTPKKIEIEVSSNLIAYVVKAIPEHVTPQTDDAVSRMASLYTYALANYLFSLYPDMADAVKGRGLDANRVAYTRGRASQQLLGMQDANGGWSWFKGMPASAYITMQVLKNTMQLNALNLLSADEKKARDKAVGYLDSWVARSYKELKDKSKHQLSTLELDYLYMRSACTHLPQSEALKEVVAFYTDLAQKQWKNKPLTVKLTTALLMRAVGDEKTVDAISRSVGEYPLPETVGEATMLLNFYGVDKPSETAALVQFILKNKKSNAWRSATETMDALYALCRVARPETAKDGVLTVVDGGKVLVDRHIVRPMVVDSFSIASDRLSGKGARLEFTNTSDATLWIGAVRSFDEQLADAAPYSNGIAVERQYYKSEKKGLQEALTPIKESDKIAVGDKIVVRLKVTTPEERSYLKLRDYFPANLENSETLSGCRFYEGSWIYESQNDQYKSFYVEQLKKGTTLFEYSLYASFEGDCRGGYAEAESLFADEFGGHTRSVKVAVE